MYIGTAAYWNTRAGALPLARAGCVPPLMSAWLQVGPIPLLSWHGGLLSALAFLRAPGELVADGENFTRRRAFFRQRNSYATGRADSHTVVRQTQPTRHQVRSDGPLSYVSNLR